MRLRAPIQLSDNSDEEDDSRRHAPSHQHHHNTRTPLFSSHSPPLSPSRPEQPPSTTDAPSPSSTLSWTSPRSAPSLASPRSLPTTSPQSPPTRQRVGSVAGGELQRQLALDVAALRIERRHQREGQMKATTQQQQQQQPQQHQQQQQQQHGHTGSGGSGGKEEKQERLGKDTLSACRSDLRELAALADEAEHWLSVMRAANTNTSTTTTNPQQHQRSGAAPAAHVT